MNIVKSVCLGIALVILFSSSAWARGGGGHGGGGHWGGGGGFGGHWGGGGHGGHWGGHGGHWGGHWGGIGFYGYPSFGYGLGFGYPYGYGYGYPYGYGYSVVPVTPPAPPVYIERPVVVAKPQPSYWYYCSNPQGYYPYVKTCSVNWVPVPPTPD